VKEQVWIFIMFVIMGGALWQHNERLKAIEARLAAAVEAVKR
jgi:hypothetical protein